MKIKLPNKTYVIKVNYAKIAYFAIMWVTIIPVLPFALLATISDPITNWYCKFGTSLSNKLNL